MAVALLRVRPVVKTAAYSGVRALCKSADEDLAELMRWRHGDIRELKRRFGNMEGVNISLKGPVLKTAPPPTVIWRDQVYQVIVDKLQTGHVVDWIIDSLPYLRVEVKSAKNMDGVPHISVLEAKDGLHHRPAVLGRMVGPFTGPKLANLIEEIRQTVKRLDKQRRKDSDLEHIVAKFFSHVISRDWRLGKYEWQALTTKVAGEQNTVHVTFKARANTTPQEMIIMDTYQQRRKPQWSSKLYETALKYNKQKVHITTSLCWFNGEPFNIQEHAELADMAFDEDEEDDDDDWENEDDEEDEEEENEEQMLFEDVSAPKV